MRFVSYLGHRLKRLGLHGWQAKVCPSGRLAGVGGSLAAHWAGWQATICKYAEAAFSSALAALSSHFERPGNAETGPNGLVGAPPEPGQARAAISRTK